jgi:hypothetical protein
LDSLRVYDIRKGFDAEEGWERDFITPWFLRKLFFRSHGCCTWCGCELKTGAMDRGDPLQASVDRLNDARGHTRGNVVLSCWGCNRNGKKRVVTDTGV